MMGDIITRIRQELLSSADAEYKAFHSSLMPTVDPERIIGIRIPILRALAKKYRGEADICEFLRDLPHLYYEENNLHAFIIEGIRDYGECIEEVRRFLPYVDNWATCDSMRPKCFQSHKDELICDIYRWLESTHTYTVRFGIEMLMVHYLDGNYREEYMKRVSEVKSDEYYVNMMIAWYFATALAKQPRDAVKYIESGHLSAWVHNKTIQKALESYRVADDMKAYLKKLRIK